MAESLTRLLYRSRSLIGPSTSNIEEEIRTILASSRRNNARAGITGALLFTIGCFAQALEGSQLAVERTFERIQRDPRHGDTIVLEMGSVTERAFPSWTMGHSGEAGPLAKLALDRAFAQPKAARGTD